TLQPGTGTVDQQAGTQNADANAQVHQAAVVGFVLRHQPFQYQCRRQYKHHTVANTVQQPQPGQQRIIGGPDLNQGNQGVTDQHAQQSLAAETALVQKQRQHGAG